MSNVAQAELITPTEATRSDEVATGGSGPMPAAESEAPSSSVAEPATTGAGSNGPEAAQPLASLPLLLSLAGLGLGVTALWIALRSRRR